MFPAINSALLAAMPRIAEACAVCFGGGEEDLSRAFLWGTGILVGCTFLIIGAIVVTIVNIERYRAEKEKTAGAHSNGKTSKDGREVRAT